MGIPKGMCLGGLDDMLRILPRRSIFARDQGNGQDECPPAPIATLQVAPAATAPTQIPPCATCSAGELVHEQYYGTVLESRGGKSWPGERMQDHLLLSKILDLQTPLWTSFASKGTDLICLLGVSWGGGSTTIEPWDLLEFAILMGGFWGEQTCHVSG